MQIAGRQAEQQESKARARALAAASSSRAPRASRSSLDAKNEFFFLLRLLVPPQSAVPLFLVLLFLSLSLYIYLRCFASGASGGARGEGRGAINGRAAPPCRDPSQFFDSLRGIFLSFFSPFHVRGSRGAGLGFSMALVNPWRAVPRSPCRFFFNAR